METTWKNIADSIAARIESGELLPGARIEAEDEIALQLAVSRHTAHRAIAELQRLGLVTRQRRWGTVVADRANKKRSIAYLVDFTSSRFESEVMMHIEQALPDGERFVVSTSKNDPEREAESLYKLQQEADGIICYPADGDANSEAFLKVAESGYPLVLVDRAPRGCEHLCVLTDNVPASEQAVRHLMRRGHHRIAFFGTNNDEAESIRERYQGYRSAVADLEYLTRPYERWIMQSLDDYAESTFQAVSDALIAMQMLPEPPTAAFCVQDRLAIGLIEACNQLNLEIGVEFGIATFNDYGPMFLRNHRRIERVLQQIDLIGINAVQRLYSLIRGEVPEPGPLRIPALFCPANEMLQANVSQLSHAA